MKIKISNLELAVIFYIGTLFILDFTLLGFITLGAYVMFNIFELIDVTGEKRRKKRENK